jgi:transposase
MEQRAVIRFFTLKGLNSKQIHSKLVPVYQTDAVTLPTVYKWSARFRIGRTELLDDPRSGGPPKNDLATGISAVLEERRFCPVRSLHGISGLQRPRAFEFFTKTWD